MAIKKDEKTKTWVVNYSKRHPITRRPHSLRRVGIKSKAEADRVYAQLILAVEAKIQKTIIPNWKCLVTEFIKSYSERGISLKTVDSYRLCLEAHTFRDWGDRLIDTITSSEIRDLIKANVGNRSPSHQKNVLKYIRAAFNFALEKGYVNRNPVPKMKFKIGNKLKAVLTAPQINTLLTQAKLMECEWYPVWAMALYTGMRNGELYALSWDKVNLDSRRIKVDCSWNNKDGFKSTKSGDDRWVEIAPELLSILKSLKLRNIDSPFVLPRIDKWEKGEQARELRMFLLGLGLPRIRFHDLRSSWATLMLVNGVEPIKVMSMAGWKDLKTMQYYIRQSGVSINGVTDSLSLHDPSLLEAEVLKFN